MKSVRDGDRGFTLIEMAVVLVVVSLVLGGLLVPLASQIDSQRRRDTRRQLDVIRDALIGFAITNGNRLPCPDLDGDGTEDRPGEPPNLCANTEGNVPWATLGVGRRDAWGRGFRYRPNNAFSAMGGAPHPPDTAGMFSVVDLTGTVALTVGNPHAPVAVIFSCGKNGVPDGQNDVDSDSTTDVGCTNPGTPDGTYVQDIPAAHAFDDMLVWLSKNTLLHRLVVAGTWP